MGLHPGQQLRAVIRFADVVNSPESESTNFVLRILKRRQVYDRYAASSLTLLQTAAYFKPVHLWHHDIQKDQIRFFFRSFESFTTACCFPDGEAKNRELCSE